MELSIGDVIVGTLILNSRVIYGTNKSGSQTREFIPYINTNNVKMMVSTKKQFQTVNIYCMVKYTHDDHKNIPHGTIVDYIGNVDSIDSEIKLQSALTTHKWNKKINKFVIDTEFDLYKSERKELDEYIFSVDPHGCEDIDDAIHINEYDDYYELGVHIADVSSYISIDGELDKEIQKRCSSVYLPINEQFDNKVHDMLPQTMANTLCSLKCKKQSRAYTVIIKLKKYTHEITDYEFIHTMINVKKNYSYDEIEKLCEKNKKVKLLYDVCESIFNNTNKNANIKYDSHKMVEICMLLTNKCAGKAMLNHPMKIFRRQKSSDMSNKDVQEDELLKDKQKIITANTAEYVLINGNINDTDISHSMLESELYTHFTSPIRRYIDILVHRILSNQKVDNVDNDVIENVNRTTKLYNFSQRTITNIHKIINVKNMHIDGHITHGHIMTIENNPYIYIPEFDMFVRVSLISPYVVDQFDFNCDNNQLIIQNKNDDNQKYTFNIFQKVELLMVILMKKTHKLKITITLPNMTLVNGEHDCDNICL